MRFNLALFASLLCSTVAAGVVDTQSSQQARDVIDVPDEPRDFHEDESSQQQQPDSELWKRRGGGGGGGGRGGGGGGGGSRGGSGSSRGGGGGRGGGSTSNGKGTNTFGNSNAGGYSRGGTGPQPGFAGGRYGGGAKVPFAAGRSSPSGMSPRSAAPFAGAALAFWPAAALWPAGAYMYGPYGYHHNYYNRSSRRDEEREIICACGENAECMCDDVDDEEFWDDLIGDGDYDKLNKSVVDVTEVNGTTKIVVNGTLPNGTTVHSSDEDDYKEYLLNAATTAGKMFGFWPAIGAVVATVYLL